MYNLKFKSWIPITLSNPRHYCVGSIAALNKPDITEVRYVFYGSTL